VVLFCCSHTKLISGSNYVDRNRKVRSVRVNIGIRKK
jgi:hypothetical protein